MVGGEPQKRGAWDPAWASHVNTIQHVDERVFATQISRKTDIHGDPKLMQYVMAHSREHPVLQQCREHAAALGWMQAMQISPDEGQFLAMCVRMLSAKKIIEVGIFTGYSALAMALALPENGVIVGCDVNKTWTDVAEGFFEAAGVRAKLDLRLGPGDETLRGLIDTGHEAQYDLGFIDADKGGYRTYYDLLYQLVRPGGVIAIDNVFWCDMVVDETRMDEDTQRVRAFNDYIAADARVELAYVTCGDGVALCYKR